MINEKSVALDDQHIVNGGNIRTNLKTSIFERTMTGFRKNRWVRSCIEIVFDLFRVAGKVTFSFGVCDSCEMIEKLLSARGFRTATGTSSLPEVNSDNSGSEPVSPLDVSRYCTGRHLIRTFGSRWSGQFDCLSCSLGSDVCWLRLLGR
jgi:hypothetical protein